MRITRSLDWGGTVDINAEMLCKIFFFLYLSVTVSINRKEENSCDISMSQHVLSGSSGLRITFWILRKRNCHSERFNMCYAIIKITRIKIDEATAQVSRAVCVSGESIYLFSLCCLFNSNRFSTVQLTRCILLTQYKINDPTLFYIAKEYVCTLRKVMKRWIMILTSAIHSRPFCLFFVLPVQD